MGKCVGLYSVQLKFNKMLNLDTGYRRIRVPVDKVKPYLGRANYADEEIRERYPNLDDFRAPFTVPETYPAGKTTDDFLLPENGENNVGLDPLLTQPRLHEEDRDEFYISDIVEIIRDDEEGRSGTGSLIP